MLTDAPQHLYNIPRNPEQTPVICVLFIMISQVEWKRSHKQQQASISKSDIGALGTGDRHG